MTDSVYGKRVAPALALLLPGFAVLFVLPAAATPDLASLADISMRRGEFLNTLVAMTANLAFIPWGQ